MKEKSIVKGKLHIELRGPDGLLKEERFLMNTIMAVGDAHIANRMSGSTSTAMSHMAVGTTDTNDNAAQTTLASETDRNALSSTIQGTAGDDNDVIYVGDWAAGDATGTLKEAGIFNYTSGGVMLCRSVFAGIVKGGSDTLKITWTITFGAS